VRKTQSKKLVLVICAAVAILGSMLSVNPVKAPPTVIDVYTWGFVNGGTNVISPPIQSAVNWASVNPPGPFTFRVHTGTYQEQVTIPSALAGSTFVAVGSVTLDGASCSLPYGFELVGTNLVTVKGFTVEHFGEAGIYLHKDWNGNIPSSQNEVRNNIIQNNCGSGILLSDSHMNDIKSNTVQSNGKIGVFVDNGLGNRIKSNTVDGNAMSGIEYHVAPRTIVIGNTVTNNGQDGLNADGYSYGATIRGNTFDHNSWNGINVLSGLNTIKDNEISNNGFNGIMLAQGDNNVVWENWIYLNGMDGIFVTYSWWNWDSSDRNSIRFNRVYGNRHGVFIYSSDWNMVWNNTIYDNLFNGIQITGESPPILAEENTVYSNALQSNGLGYPPPSDWVGVDLYYDGWYGWLNNHWGTSSANDNNFGTWAVGFSFGTPPLPT